MVAIAQLNIEDPEFFHSRNNFFGKGLVIFRKESLTPGH